MRSYSFIIALVSYAALSGCGAAEPTRPAGGRVTVDGEPVTLGKVVFHPVAGGRTGSGRIKPDGSFLLSYRRPGDGAPIGDYKVTIVGDLMDDRATPADGDGFTIVGGRLIHVVPVKYNTLDTTPLKVTITESRGSQHFDFDLSSEE